MALSTGVLVAMIGRDELKAALLKGVGDLKLRLLPARVLLFPLVEKQAGSVSFSSGLPFDGVLVHSPTRTRLKILFRTFCFSFFPMSAIGVNGCPALSEMCFCAPCRSLSPSVSVPVISVELLLCAASTFKCMNAIPIEKLAVGVASIALEPGHLKALSEHRCSHSIKIQTHLQAPNRYHIVTICSCYCVNHILHIKGLRVGVPGGKWRRLLMVPEPSEYVSGRYNTE